MLGLINADMACSLTNDPPIGFKNARKYAAFKIIAVSGIYGSKIDDVCIEYGPSTPTTVTEM